MKVPIIWQTYKPDTIARGYWDFAQLERLFSGDLWQVPSSFTFQHYEGFDTLPEATEVAVVVIPAQHQVDYIQQLNQDLLRFKKVLLILAGDEEARFDWRKVEHPSVKFWVMSPRPGLEYPEGARFIGEGPAPDAYKYLPQLQADHIRPLDWFLAGQITHDRRQQCAKQLRGLKGGQLIETPGFTQGLRHQDYYAKLASAKVAPCPSGPGTADSFRFYEALEAGCVPIADDLTPRSGDPGGYWHLIYPDAPFPILRDYDDLPGYIEDAVKQYPWINNRIGAWWLAQKRQLAYGLHEDLAELTGERPKSTEVDDLVTVLIPCSPIPSHPSTEILDETIASIRYHLPRVEILLSLDGVRKEHEHYRAAYEQFIQRVLWKCQHEWKNVVGFIHEEHTHQVGMARRALEEVHTPLLLYVESDAPVVTDEPIDWVGLTSLVLEGKLDVARLHFEARIPDEHKHLMFDDQPHYMRSKDGSATWIIRTSQWSSRPHLSTAAFYRRILANHFSEKARCFVEDVMHGVVQGACAKDGLLGWQQYKLGIYAPEGNFKRSLHTDGRAGTAKLDGDQVF